ncbi:Fasciclin domain-containing protein [Lasiodiplodia theobromae]|uniref:Fasciclin-like arabinogalactan protein n=1 Tax=Lasiodiplodia theobromae TaxID=45133 RepID=A0A5N5DHR1_9PEZI|nr:Fasciclin domain-containing protein [Lasiodiplodia theobromae]KAB2576552.1 Fasciclin-like arabinogalactan protein [Lasiodiplodia theobromae]KAF4546638.1 Fasciclin domain-containing protein [Lasiodiplodia theobromae]
MLKHITLAALASMAFAQTQDLNATLSGIPELSNLTSYYISLPDSLSALSAARNITILAPSNNAFEQLLSSPLGAALTNDPDLVQAMLTYHVLNGSYSSSQITEDSQFIPTLLTDPRYTNVTGGQRVEVEKEDGNDVFYSGLRQNLTLGRSDINFTGGYIHIIDTVLTLPPNVSSTAVATNLTALVGALTNASLVGAVDTTPDVTIFAPANDAFAAIGSVLDGTSSDDLSNLLSYHVVNGTVAYSSDLQGNQTVTALNGGDLTIRVLDDGDVFVNGARVIIPDILVANGVVHVIDNVLNPSNSTSGPSDENDDSGDVQYTGATSATNVPFTSGVATATATVGVTGTGGGGGATGTATGTGGAASASASGAAAGVGLSGGLMGVAVGLGGVVLAL